jgi:hypothetical protein
MTPVQVCMPRIAKRVMLSESYSAVSIQLRRGVSAGTFKINENKTRVVTITHQLKPTDAHFTLNRRNITFVSHVKYLGVLFDKKVTWKFNIEVVVTKAFRTFIIVYTLFKNERLRTNIKLTLHEALIISFSSSSIPIAQLGA